MDPRGLEGGSADLANVQVAYIVAVYGVLGWLVNRSINVSLPAASADEMFWALRSRADVALALCLIAYMNALVAFMVLEVGYRWLAFGNHLAEIATALGDVSTWNWRFRVERDPRVSFWRVTKSLFLLPACTILPVWILWFAYPATRSSGIIRFAWWSAAVINLVFPPAVVAFVARYDGPKGP